MEILDRAYQCIINFNLKEAESISKELKETEVPREEAVRKINEALFHIAEKYEKREIALPEIVAATHCFMEIGEALKIKGPIKGTVVLGTVDKDVHSIGKNLVKGMLIMGGYKVHDLGMDVPAEKFVEKVKETNAQILGMSALMTTTMGEMKKVIELLKREGIAVKVMIGGAPVTPEYARYISADGYASDAVKAIKVADELMEGRKCYL